MFRLSSAIGKACLTLPNKYQPNKHSPALTCLRAKCGYTRQAKVVPKVGPCPSMEASPPVLKLAVHKCLRLVKYVALSLVVTVAATGGLIAYAKSDPELRDWLTILMPTLDEVIAIAYQESMTYGDFIAMSKEYFGYADLEDEPNENHKRPCPMDL